jgi:hypothetical protein
MDERYQELIDTLILLKDEVDNGADEPRATQMALTAVFRYLNADPLCAKLFLTRLLSIALRELHDLHRRERAHGTKPTELAHGAFRAQINLMFEVLLRGGEAKAEASEWLAGELRDFTEAGEPITAAQIIRWHSEIKGKSLSGSDRAYERLKQKYEGRWPTSIEEARFSIQALICSLRETGF